VIRGHCVRIKEKGGSPGVEQATCGGEVRSIRRETGES